MSINWVTLTAIFIGGGAGSVARAVLGVGVNKITSAGVHLAPTIAPLGILAANVIATGLLAALIIYGGDKWGRDSIWMPLLAIGFCGGFSTFSTFSIDTLRLFQEGSNIWAIANILVNVVTCLAVGWVVFKVWAK
jgi:CrcB protein